MGTLGDLRNLISDYLCTVEGTFDKKDELFIKIDACNNNYNRIRSVIAKEVKQTFSMPKTNDYYSDLNSHLASWKGFNENRCPKSFLFAYFYAIECYAALLFMKSSIQKRCTLGTILSKAFTEDDLERVSTVMSLNWDTYRKELCERCQNYCNLRKADYNEFISQATAEKQENEKQFPYDYPKVMNYLRKLQQEVNGQPFVDENYQWILNRRNTRELQARVVFYIYQKAELLTPWNDFIKFWKYKDFNKRYSEYQQIENSRYHKDLEKKKKKNIIFESVKNIMG